MKNFGKPIVAAFDFDGTLTYHDLLLPFLSFVGGKIPTFYKLFQTIPTFLGFPLGIFSRQQVKEKLLERCLGGMEIAQGKAYGEKFAAAKVQPYLNQDRMKLVQEHQSQGHRCTCKR